MRGRPFHVRLLPLLVLALVARLVYSLLIVKTQPLIGDGLEFHDLALAIADGHGYVRGSPLSPNEVMLAPTADKPPLYPLVLAAFTKIGGYGWTPHQVAGALIGTGTVAAVGFLGRRVGGDLVGLIAAAVAAVYPMLIAADGSYRTESLYALLIALTLLAAYRLADKPSGRRAVVCGAFVGLATLTRTEAIVLLVLLVLPAALLAVPRRRALTLTGVATIAAVVVLSPWLIRDWITFNRPVFVSTNSGSLLAGANCATTYHGEWLGQWVFSCLAPPTSSNEAVVSAHEASKGLRYARDHASRLPVVIAARVGRTWELYRPRQQWRIEHFFEGRNLRIEQAGVLMYYLLAGLAVYGAVLLHRRREPLRILIAPAVLVTLISIVGYGFTRFRIAADISIVVLAAVSLEVLAARLLQRMRAAPQPASERSA